MGSHDDYIIFAAYIILFVVPGAVLNIGVSYCKDLVIKVCAVLGQLEPDLVTIYIDLLGCDCIALSEVKGLTDSQSVLVVAVKQELGQNIRLAVHWHIFLCKEAHLGVLSCPVIVCVAYFLDSGCVYKSVVPDGPWIINQGDPHGLGTNVVVNIIIESCEFGIVEIHSNFT